jgi:cob(I)alamin adenosyltransferase
MVKLTRIYTRTGDDGSTGLGDGSRVSKTDARVEAYGTVDEANAAIGWCLTQLNAALPRHADLGALLRSIQHDLFDVGADLCCPVESGDKPGERLRISPAQTKRLEEAIDLHNQRLGTLTSFVLPGGTILAAALHVARTVVRRAERLTVDLAARQPAATNPETVKYLNRLSDLLFVLARVANDDGRQDVLWVPGANR